VSGSGSTGPPKEPASLRAGRSVQSQRGSVSVVAAAVAALTLVLAMGCADVARALTASARAQNAADAAALAVAQELAFPGGRDPSELAADYAARNGATVTGYTAGSFEVTVEVAVPVGALLLFPDDRVATATARAVVDLGTG
jgi:Flp pilus assembly protein TadG